MEIYDSIVIGAGQAGLSASFHLKRLGISHVVLDANQHPGGAWQHRWKSLTMHDVHGIASLPDMAVPDAVETEPAREFVPGYFGDYEAGFNLPVRRPVKVRSARDVDGLIEVQTDIGTFAARTLVNATGTWTQPFIPFYPGADVFAGRQLHTVDFDGAEEFRGKRVIVVGGGASAVQILGELAGVADTLWVTRRPPVWRKGPFGQNEGRDAVAMVEQRVRLGLPPQSVVSVTGLMLRPQEQHALEVGAYDRRPMFSHLEAEGARWSDDRFERADVILWATGFRPAIGHLSGLHLRGPLGGIQLDGTTAVVDPRVQLVGYGPSASTIGANRAGRTAANGVRQALRTADQPAAV